MDNPVQVSDDMAMRFLEAHNRFLENSLELQRSQGEQEYIRQVTNSNESNRTWAKAMHAGALKDSVMLGIHVVMFAVFLVILFKHNLL